MKALACSLAYLSLAAASIPAQEIRYQLGLRVRAFERGFEPLLHDLSVRKRVCPGLEKAVSSFFSLRLPEVGRQMDRARNNLKADAAGDAKVRWAESLAFEPKTRLCDSKQRELGFTLQPFYTVEGVDLPATARLRLSLKGRGKTLLEAQSSPIGKLPMTGKLALKGVPEGDHQLQIEVLSNDVVLSQHEQVISFADNLEARIARILPHATADISDNKSATLRGMARLLRTLHRGRTLESDVLAARSLARTEAILAGTQRAVARIGTVDDFRLWLRLGRRTVAMRVALPPKSDLGSASKVPLVIAMHGAGGSENLFFEGYGAGKIVQLCKARGWLLVTPRSGLFGRGGGAKALISALAENYPIDRSKVFAVGHSMGAGQLMKDAGRNPEVFKAVAALGGGGSPKASAAIRKLPFFVAPGARDFARPGAQRLKSSLQRLGVKTLVYREYPATEHLGIVQVALDDVFAFFDAHLK